jgi:hypothetical protein
MKVRHHWALAALSVAVIGSTSLSHAAPVSGQGTWETTLQARDLDGNLATAEAYYDTDLNITWLANANYAGTTMDWTTANSWAAGLDPYGSGITNWRLPTTIDADGPDAGSAPNDGCNFTPSQFQGLDCGYNISVHSEMSHMFYVTLGDKAFYDTTGTGPQPGWGLTNTGPFANVQANYYWSATQYATNTSFAWSFNFLLGDQGFYNKTANFYYAWAVHSGDVGASTVPVPATVWLFGSGLIGLLGMSRKRRR